MRNMGGTKFFNPKTLAEALSLLEQYREKGIVVNGGTDIVEQIAKGSVNAEAIIYIQNIRELKHIQAERGFVRICGAVTYNQVLGSPDCLQFTAIQNAIAQCGSPPIRAVGTPAGNIGTAAPAADCNVALIALGADIVLACGSAERTVPAKDIFTGPWRTLLQPNELIKEIRISVLKSGAGSGFLKLAKRKAQDIAQVSVAVRLSVEGEIISDISIALGAVAPTAVKSLSFEAMAKGKTLKDAVAAIKGSVPDEASLRSPRNKAYKEAVMGVLTARAIEQAFADAQRRN